MRIKAAVATALALGVAGCATGPTRFPVEASRFHYDAVADRGTVSVEPVPGAQDAGLEYQAYVDAVRAELARNGFTPAAPGTAAQFVAVVQYRRQPRPLPPRRSPIQIGIGGGSYSGGWHGGGGVGGGVSFPVGGSGGREGVVTEMNVRLKRGPDAIWEGNASSLSDVAAPDGTTGAIAQRLAAAMFKDFPGQSGRTIQVP